MLYFLGRRNGGGGQCCGFDYFFKIFYRELTPEPKIFYLSLRRSLTHGTSIIKALRFVRQKCFFLI